MQVNAFLARSNCVVKTLRSVIQPTPLRYDASAASNVVWSSVRYAFEMGHETALAVRLGGVFIAVGYEDVALTSSHFVMLAAASP